MEATAIMNYDGWLKRFRENTQMLGLNTKDELRRQVRLFTKTMINLTPPTHGSMPGGGKVDPKVKAQAVGENAVRRDVLRVAVPVDLSWKDAPTIFQMPALRKAIIGGQYSVFVAILKKLGKWSNWQVGMWDRSQHNRLRNSRGRVAKSRKFFVFGESQLPDYWAYMQRVISHVGRMKAGWLPAYLALGGNRVPQFIRRHIRGARGRISERLEGYLPVIEIANSAMGARQLDNIVSSTLRARTQAMKREFKLITSNYAKAVQKGIVAARDNRNKDDSE